MTLRTLASGAALLAAAGTATLHAQPRPERARFHDNRARAGILMAGTMAIRLEARLAQWHPLGDDRPGMTVPVFAEAGRPAQVPGPLIRVPGGTNVIVTVRNLVPDADLTIHGLHSRPAPGAAFNDSIQLAPGAVRTLRFRLDRPGTYYYWGTTTGRAFVDRAADAQLTGAIVVDEPDERSARDRIFVLGKWTDSATAPGGRQRALYLVNGRSWPLTDRLVIEQRDQVRWRMINASPDAHPVYLHGFHVRVSRRGDGRADTALARAELAHTERLAPGATASLQWTAERLGNWLFHSTVPAHYEPRGPFGAPAHASSVAAAPLAWQVDPNVTMGGMVAAVEVVRAEDDTTTLPAVPPPLPQPARRLRLLLRVNTGSTPSTPFYGVTLHEEGLEPDVARGQTVGPTLVLARGELTSVMVVNRTPEPTTLHWHGLETDNAVDGVPGHSGVRPEIAGAIQPNDSMEVRLAPARAGTFTYHSHVQPARQMAAGIAGMVIVADKGRPWDPARDTPVLVSTPSDSVEAERAVLINGAMAPPVVVLRRGAPHRLRLASLAVRPGIIGLELRHDAELATWRVAAKDGVELPAAARVTRVARQTLGTGETVDVEFFPTRAGEHALDVRGPDGQLLGVLPIRVQ